MRSSSDDAGRKSGQCFSINIEVLEYGKRAFAGPHRAATTICRPGLNRWLRQRERPFSRLAINRRRRPSRHRSILANAESTAGGMRRRFIISAQRAKRAACKALSGDAVANLINAGTHCGSPTSPSICTYCSCFALSPRSSASVLKASRTASVRPRAVRARGRNR